MSVKHIGRFIYIAVAAVSVLAAAGLAGCSSLSGCVKEAVQTETEKDLLKMLSNLLFSEPALTAIHMKFLYPHNFLIHMYTSGTLLA